MIINRIHSIEIMVGIVRAGQNGRLPPDVKAFFRGDPRVETQPRPNVTKVTVFQVVAEVRNMAKGWNSAIQKALSIPGEIYRRQDGPFLIFAKKETDLDAVADAADALKRGIPIKQPLPEYGLVVYETTSQSYLVLIDRKHGKIVHDMIRCLHTPELEGWTELKKAFAK